MNADAATATAGGTPLDGGAMRACLSDIFMAGLAAVRGDTLVEARSSFADGVWRYRSERESVDWELPEQGRVIVIGAGKAAASLALGLERTLGDRIDDGYLVVKYGHGEPLRRIRVAEAGHPVPDEAGLAATRELMRLASDLGPDDRVFMVLTGGASALLVSPVAGVTLDEKALVTDLMLRSGAAIDEMNEVRKALSRVKGGGLLDAIGAAPVTTLVISDVPGGRSGTIGSAPTVRDRASRQHVRAILAKYDLLDRLAPSIRRHLETPADEMDPSVDSPVAGNDRFIVLADSGTALDAAKLAAEQAGFATKVVDPDLAGGTHVAATAFAVEIRRARAERNAGGPPRILLAAGETTLRVTGDGLGGRNQEFALVVAREIAGVPDVAMLAGGTDGTDGPTDAAGAFADGESWLRAREVGLDPALMLRRNDSHRLFSALGDLYVTGATGTNVMDLVIAVVP
ncbi:glycerate kinase type-2 family protein [Sphingomonas profundi]|uniref:glycerate kinase type-2 family protein n=1 Tax=Alterirhizorhabdus profundi TaxID=2681549 RepID=UPI0018D0444A|nr:DUF4147 domain-containing protein [Sphingomonas profundi]